LKVDQSPLTAIVVLNYRGAADTIACVASLKQLDYPAFEIIVVDNASADGSVEAIRQAHPDVTLMVSETNGGFGAGNNLGMAEALKNPKVAYVWVLNNDTTVASDALKHLINTAEKHPRSLVGPIVLHPDGRFQRVGSRVERFRGALRFYRQGELQVEGQPVESLTGSSILIPRAVLEAIQGWDESYFLYFEDNDFCLRAQEKGYSCRVSLEARIYHQEGATTGRNKPLVTYYYQRNRLLFLRQFSTPLQFRVAELYTRYRLFRSTIKSRLSKSSDAGRHHRMFQLAVSDFYRGIRGKCPHEV
jgi:GT2 family glycosyltransferase